MAQKERTLEFTGAHYCFVANGGKKAYARNYSVGKGGKFLLIAIL